MGNEDKSPETSLSEAIKFCNGKAGAKTPFTFIASCLSLLFKIKTLHMNLLISFITLR